VTNVDCNRVEVTNVVDVTDLTDLIVEVTHLIDVVAVFCTVGEA
jgi:hypothetical protein